MANVRLDRISKAFGNVEVVHDVSLEVAHGEFVVFVGPSGSGKSTLLRMIGGLESVTSGTMSIDGQVVNDVDAADRNLGMVFQSYALYPHMSVAQNLAFPLRMAKAGQHEIREKVERAATLLQIEHLLERKPRQLSGGQRQRVAIGRAIVREPKVFLFDEPLSNLDAEMRVQMRVHIAKLHRRLGNTMIYVTHDQVEAMTMADKIVVLRGGRLEQVGTPHELYHRPVSRFVAGFIGSPQMNFFQCTFKEGDARTSRLVLSNGGEIVLPIGPVDRKPGSAIVLGVRPDDFTTGSGSAGQFEIPIAIDVIEHLGSASYVYGSFGDQPVVAKAPPGRVRMSDKEVTLAVCPDDCYLFSPDDQAYHRHRVPEAWS